jgi:hypothetical protein
MATKGKGKQGKQFEEDFKSSCQKTLFFFLRLVDSVKWGNSEGSTFTPKNIADAVFFTSPLFWILELKSTEGSGISFSPYETLKENPELVNTAPWLKETKLIKDGVETKTQRMIKYSQVKDLMKINESHGNEGVICGFILNYRERVLKTKTIPNRVFFLHISDFIDFAKTTGKSSISLEDAESIGVEIFGTIKKVNYTYDISDFINRACKIYLNKGYINKDFLEKIRIRIEKLLFLSEKGEY